MASIQPYPQCPLPDNSECVTYLTRGQSIGLSVATEMGFISAVAVTMVFCVILINVARKVWNPPSEGWRFFRSPLDVYMLSLLMSDLLQGLGKILDVKWLHEGIVQCGSYCTAQGIVQQIGETGVAQATLAIAVHTFIIIFFRKGAEAVKIAFFVVFLIWTYVILFAAIATARHTHENQKYITPTIYWCWIGSRFTSERLAAEYFWLWFTAFLSIALYLPLFFCLRGNLEPDERQWWKIRVRRGPNIAGSDSKATREAAIMLLYPATYFVLVLPDSLCRWIGPDRIPSAAVFFATTVFGLSGLVNVLLLLFTRRGLLLLRAGAGTPPAPPAVEAMFGEEEDEVASVLRGAGLRLRVKGGEAEAEAEAEAEVESPVLSMGAEWAGGGRRTEV